MKGKNFAPALFLIGGVVAVTLLAPKPKRRKGSAQVYEISITNEMIVSACDELGVEDDANAIAARVLQANYPQVPPQAAMEEVLQEIRRVKQIANERGMTICQLAVAQASAKME